MYQWGLCPLEHAAPPATSDVIRESSYRVVEGLGKLGGLRGVSDMPTRQLNDSPTKPFPERPGNVMAGRGGSERQSPCGLEGRLPRRPRRHADDAGEDLLVEAKQHEHTNGGQHGSAADTQAGTNFS